MLGKSGCGDNISETPDKAIIKPNFFKVEPTNNGVPPKVPTAHVAGTKKPTPIINAPVNILPKPLPAPVITGLIEKI